MKTVTVALQNLINSIGGQTPLIHFDLITISLPGGGTLLFTDADFAITAADATIWQAPKIDGSGNMWTAAMVWAPAVLNPDGNKQTGHWKIGLDSDSWQFAIAPRLADAFTGDAFPDKIGSMPWLQAARSGAFDDADIIVSRAYFASMPKHPIPLTGVSPVGTLLIFRGLVGDVDCSTTTAYLSCNDYKSILSQQMPRNVYQSSCRHRLFDARCTLSSGSFSSSGTAAAGSDDKQIHAVVTPPGGSGTFTLGTLKMTSGPNLGFSRMVANWNSNTFSFLNPFPFAISTGDAFTVTAGCNKTQAACSAFANLVNFSGETYIPIPEVSTG